MLIEKARKVPRHVQGNAAELTLRFPVPADYLMDKFIAKCQHIAHEPPSWNDLMPTSAFIRVPQPRAEQVRRAALAAKVPISTWIELKLAEEISKGLIPDELPGFEVQAVDDGFGSQNVRMNMDGVALPDMDPPIAKLLGMQIKKVVVSRGVGENASLNTSLVHPMTLTCTLTVERRGRGVILTRSDTGATSSLTFPMAFDLHRHLLREGNRIQAREQAEGAAA